MKFFGADGLPRVHCPGDLTYTDNNNMVLHRRWSMNIPNKHDGFPIRRFPEKQNYNFQLVRE